MVVAHRSASTAEAASLRRSLAVALLMLPLATSTGALAREIDASDAVAHATPHPEAESRPCRSVPPDEAASMGSGGSSLPVVALNSGSGFATYAQASRPCKHFIADITVPGDHVAAGHHPPIEITGSLSNSALSTRELCQNATLDMTMYTKPRANAAWRPLHHDWQKVNEPYDDWAPDRISLRGHWYPTKPGAGLGPRGCQLERKDGAAGAFKQVTPTPGASQFFRIFAKGSVMNVPVQVEVQARHEKIVH